MKRALSFRLIVAVLFIALLACDLSAEQETPPTVVFATVTPTSTSSTPVTPIPATPIPATPLPSATVVINPGFEIATVINVVDGDTIDVLLNGKEYRVRYILVNTPETKHPTKGIEPFGPEAYAANKQLVEGKTVYLEKDVSETDRYGRLLRYVYLTDRMVNEELLRLGLAQVSTFPPDVKYVDRFLAVQRQAQETGIGMWGNWGHVEIVTVNAVDEYVEIVNRGYAEQALAGWTLLSEQGGQRCPLGGTLAVDQSLRVWTMAKDAAEGDYTCGLNRAIWNNSGSDPAVLLDETGKEVHRLD